MVDNHQNCNKRVAMKKASPSNSTSIRSSPSRTLNGIYYSCSYSLLCRPGPGQATSSALCRATRCSTRNAHSFGAGIRFNRPEKHDGVPVQKPQRRSARRLARTYDYGIGFGASVDWAICETGQFGLARRGLVGLAGAREPTRAASPAPHLPLLTHRTVLYNLRGVPMAARLAPATYVGAGVI
jgi:hypothetical protein